MLCIVEGLNAIPDGLVMFSHSETRSISTMSIDTIVTSAVSNRLFKHVKLKLELTFLGNL